jgi:hypothetical protein
MPNKESEAKETERNKQQQANKQIKNIKHKVEENVKYGINQKKQKGMTMVKNKCLRVCVKTKKEKKSVLANCRSCV